MAEAYASAGSAIALYGAQRTGQGQFVDVACIEASAMALESSPQLWDLEGKIRRGRGREAASGSIHPCADGYVVLLAIVTNSKASWDAFVNWMRDEDAENWTTFANDKWLDSGYRASQEGYETFCRIFEKYAATRTKLQLYETGQKHNIAISPVSNGRDLLENPQLSHRGFWQRVRNETLDGDVVYPGAPYEFGEMQWRFGRNAPRLGEHTSEILRELAYSPSDVGEFKKMGAIYAE